MICRDDAEIDEKIFDFLDGIFDRAGKYTGHDPVIEEEEKKMGGFGTALVEKTEPRVREQAQREKNGEMLRNGKKFPNDNSFLKIRDFYTLI